MQQLRAEVRECSQVRGALQFVYALNSRNYVRFFKLARKNANYLQCCLLQRYFHQMRSSALQIMVQAYGPPKKGQVGSVKQSQMNPNEFFVCLFVLITNALDSLEHHHLFIGL